MALNIAQFVDVFYPSVDGVVKVVDNYARILNSYDDVHCSVFAPKISWHYKDEFPYHVYRSKSIPFAGDYVVPMPGISPELIHDFRKSNIDIVHAHSPFTIGHFAYELAHIARVPFVMTFHSKYYEDFYNVTKSKTMSKILTDYVVNLYTKADSVWTVSEKAAQTLQNYGYKGKIEIVENGTDFDVPANPEQLRKVAAKRFKIPENRKVLIFVGRILPQKNIGLTLKTMNLLKNEGYTLVLVGSGNLDYARKYAETNGFAENLILTGEINNKELLSGLYLLSDLLFFPSTYDTFAIVVREAAMLGKPSLLMKDSAAAENIIDGQNGFTFEGGADAAAAKIRKIFNDREKLVNAGASAGETLPRTWEQIVPEVLDRYYKILGSR